MRSHQSFFLKLLESHVSEVINSLLPAEFAHIVISDFNQIFSKNFESVLRSLCVWRVELAVDFFSNDLAKNLLSIDEGTILDVEVEIAE